MRIPFTRTLMLKLLLLSIGLLIVISYAFYTQHLVGRLRSDARANLTILVENYKLKIILSASDALQSGQSIDFPLILTDAVGTPKFWKNVGIDQGDYSPEAIAYLKERVRFMDENGHTPIELDYNGITDYFHYGDSPLIRKIQFFPYLGLLAIGGFILFGYIAFTWIRRNEETMVWVGMAKETAHQLGTPISSLLGWVELMKFTPPGEDALQAMQEDLDRLQKVASRFSKIGSKVDLKEQPLDPVIEQVVNYFRKRLPMQSRNIILEEEFNDDHIAISFNAFLLEWVIENLLKNSLDAITEDSGFIKISTSLSRNGEWVSIEVVDSGKGIEPGVRNQIFRPGFSTKKRGWGLGLSLARRIVENYHGGRIQVKDTRPGVGTVIHVRLSTHLTSRSKRSDQEFS